LAMARNCYEEATRICPASQGGRLAGKRLTELAAASVNGRRASGGVEAEEEPPLPRNEQEINRDQQLEPRRVLKSQKMLLLGERYQRTGDLDNAYRCFEDAYLICPGCQYGQSALDRMRQIEAARARELPPRHGG